MVNGIKKYLLFIVLLSGQLVNARELFCIDPDTNLRYPINSTWSATSFCGNFHCTKLTTDSNGRLRSNSGGNERIHNLFRDGNGPDPNIVFVENRGKNDAKEHGEEDYNSETHEMRQLFKNSPANPETRPEYSETGPEYYETGQEIHTTENHHLSGKTKFPEYSENINLGLKNIDSNFKEFETDTAYDQEDYENILNEYFTNTQRKPIKEILKEKILKDQEIDSRSSGTHPAETMSKIDGEEYNQVDEQLIGDTQINEDNDNDALLYYDYTNKVYTPEKPDNFHVYEQFYKDYMARKTDVETGPTENNYSIDNVTSLEDQSANKQNIPNQPMEIEERQLPEYNTDDQTVLSGWIYNYPKSENDLYSMLNHRAIKELSEEMGVKENTLKLAMIMEDQGLVNGEIIPTVKYTLDSDSESAEIEKQDTNTNNGEESIVDLARNLIRSLSSVSLPLDKSRSSRNQRSSRLSKLNPRIRERLLGRSRFTRSATYEDDISSKESESIPFITVIGCPETSTPGYYTSDPSKPFPQCCPQLIQY